MPTDGVTVQPLFNGDVVSLTQGMIVRQVVGAADTVVRAQADISAHVLGVLGVVTSGSVAPGGVVVVEALGRQRVLLEAGLTLTNAETIFVSATSAGRGTNVQPATAQPIGTVVDTTAYATNATAVIVVSSNTGVPGPAGTNGGIAYVDSINTTGTTLVALASAPLGPDTLAWVNTVGAYFRLADGSSLTLDPMTVVAAAGRAGAQWIRLNLYNKAWEAQATWAVDPQNTTGLASDENTGLNAAAPLRSYAEHARRLFDTTESPLPS